VPEIVDTTSWYGCQEQKEHLVFAGRWLLSCSCVVAWLIVKFVRKNFRLTGGKEESTPTSLKNSFLTVKTQNKKII
jgi:hypothetical protein